MKVRILVDCFVLDYPGFKSGNVEVLPDDLAKVLIERQQAEVFEESTKVERASKTPKKA